MRITVVGSGTWGTALAIVLSRFHDVTILCRREEVRDLIRNERRHKNLPGISIPKGIRASCNMPKTLENTEMIVLAVPSHAVKETSAKIREYVYKGEIVVIVSKGIDRDSLMPLSDIVKREIPNAEIGVLSGPSHAEEVSRYQPTTVVAAAENLETAEIIQNTFMTEYFRVYTNTDIKGVETGAALKNVIALAAGIADGIGYGDNSKAALITRGIFEISRLGTAMGCNKDTFAGLSGIGDLIVTCASMYSRNRRAGIYIGEGLSAKEAMDKVGMVVEGVYAAKSALMLSKKYNVSMPIVSEINKVLFDGKDPKHAVMGLMLRDPKLEH